uniref:Uncharacterized protein n=1 Tax=Anguilla anguilla TaxID=7936 RepID=A0A0E9TFN3_ANGAN
MISPFLPINDCEGQPTNQNKITWTITCPSESLNETSH